MLLFVDYQLLTDAEIPEDVPQYLVRRNFSDNGTKMVDGFADVLGGKVCGEAGGEAVADAEEGSAGVGESLDMALVCDEGGVAVAKKILLGL